MFGITALEISFVFKYKKTFVKNHCPNLKMLPHGLVQGIFQKLTPHPLIPNPNTNPQPNKKEQGKLWSIF